MVRQLFNFIHEICLGKRIQILLVVSSLTASASMMDTSMTRNFGHSWVTKDINSSIVEIKTQLGLGRDIRVRFIFYTYTPTESTRSSEVQSEY